jgi:hypothetical protein
MGETSRFVLQDGPLFGRLVVCADTMSDDPAKILLADTAITAGERSSDSTRRFFRRKKKAGPPPLTHCENCGSLLTGRFCGQCGQPAVDYRRSFRHVIVDVLDSFLNWDSKFLASLVHLIVRPWKLTNEFLAGHRVRYLNPLRLYLLASVLFFFMANYGERQAEKSGHAIKFDSQEEVPFGDVHEPKPGATPPIDRPGDADADADNDMERPPFVVGIDKSRTPTVFEAWMQQKIEEKIGRNGSKATFFLHSLMENLPYMMLACIPLFAFVLKILYFFRRVFYIDHLIYALHIHSFAYVMSLIITGVGLGLNQALPEFRPIAVGLLVTTAFIQILISIRKVYRQGWFMTLFKFFAGGFVYFIVLMIAFGVTAFVTIAMP